MKLRQSYQEMCHSREGIDAPKDRYTITDLQINNTYFFFVINILCNFLKTILQLQSMAFGTESPGSRKRSGFTIILFSRDLNVYVQGDYE